MNLNGNCNCNDWLSFKQNLQYTWFDGTKSLWIGTELWIILDKNINQRKSPT